MSSNAKKEKCILKNPSLYISFTHIIYTTGAVILLIACVVIAQNIQTRHYNKKIEKVIVESRAAIMAKDYKKGCLMLSEYKNSIKAADYNREIQSLYNYAYLKKETNSNISQIEKQHDRAGRIYFQEDDEFFSDAENLKETINKRYSKYILKRKAEQRKDAVISEIKKAKKRRKRLEKLTKRIPYEGMAEYYIDCTACGAHDVEIIGQHLTNYYGDPEEPHLLEFNIYKWHVDDELVLTVYCTGGKVDFDDKLVYESGSISDYWTDDAKPLFKSKKYSDSPKYLTGKEYADSHYKKWLNKLKNQVGYKSFPPSDLEDIAWMKAYNKWLKMHNAEQEEPSF